MIRQCLLVACIAAFVCQARAACPPRPFPPGATAETVDASTVHRFTLDGRATQVAAFAVDGTVLVWDLGSGREHVLLDCHPIKVNALAFDGDAVKLVTGDAEGKLEVFAPQAAKAPPTVVHTGSAIDALLFKPGSRELVVVHKDRFALWSLTEGRQLWDQKANYVEAMAFDPSGRFLAAGFSTVVRVVATDNGHLRQRISPELGIVNAVLFTADSRQLLVAGETGLALFDLKSGRQVRRFDIHADVSAIGISSDHRYLTTVDSNALVMRWNLVTGAAIEKWQSVASGIISKDGQFLVGKMRDVPGEIGVWDVDSQREYRKLNYISPNANKVTKTVLGETAPFWYRWNRIAVGQGE